MRRARAEPRWLESVYRPTEARCASETALSLVAQPCSDVITATASNELPTFACAHTRTRQSVLSLGRRRSTRACGVRAPSRAGWSRFTALRKLVAPARRLSSSLHSRAPTCQPGPPSSSRRSRVRTRDRATACSVLGGGAARALAVCARRATLVRNGPYPMEARCASVTAIYLGARPCSDVAAAASNEHSRRLRVRTRERATACSLSISPKTPG